MSGPQAVVPYDVFQARLSASYATLAGLPFVNVQDSPYGAIGDGVADCTAAFTAAIAARPHGIVFVPTPTVSYKISSTITVPRGVMIMGPIPGTGDGGKIATIDHAFDGNLFVLDGSGGALEGVGGGFENLLIRQAFGNGAGGGRGTAIKIVGTDLSNRPTWLRLRNVNIEKGAANDPWTICVDVDGSAIAWAGIIQGLRDTFIEDCRFIGASTAAMRLNYAVNQHYRDIHMDGETMLITGPDANRQSNTVYLNNIALGTLNLDYAGRVFILGGIYGTIATTVNTDSTFYSVSAPDVVTTTTLGANVELRRRATVFSATVVYNAPNLVSLGYASTTVTVAGARLGDVAVAHIDTQGTNDLVITACVQTGNTVRVVLFNPTGGPIDLASGNLTVNVFRVH